MIQRIKTTLCVLIFTFISAPQHISAAEAGKTAPKPVEITDVQAPAGLPKLVLLLVVDQFRSDTIGRFETRFLPAESGGKIGGFRYLITRGAYYQLGEYDIAQCMTGPGHATVLTGSHPYANGIAQNNWFDQKTQKRVYCAQDDSTAIVGNDKPRERAGSSPANLIGSTLGDELKNTGFRSKVVSISLKDRSAIFMGGHRADLALWHDSDVMRWVTSRKYRPDGKLPEWVERLNAKLSSDGATKKQLAGPYGVALTVDAAIEAMKSEKLGKGAFPDLLAVSISSHDYVVHGFGPLSPEAAEITVAEDRAISRLLNEAAAHVPGGLKNVTLAMTADHGGGNPPELQVAAGVPAGRIDEKAILKKAEAAITAELGPAPEGQAWVPLANDFAFYLNRPALERRPKNALARAEAILKKTILAEPGVMFAVSFTDWATKNVPPGEIGRRFNLTYFPGRSGDVILIPRPNFLNGDDDTAGHITPFSYDRYVPIIFVGPQFKPRRYAESAKVVDIAPTLAFLLKVTPPSLSEGRVLSEALK